MAWLTGGRWECPDFDLDLSPPRSPSERSLTPTQVEKGVSEYLGADDFEFYLDGSTIILERGHDLAFFYSDVGARTYAEIPLDLGIDDWWKDSAYGLKVLIAGGCIGRFEGHYRDNVVDAWVSEPCGVTLRGEPWRMKGRDGSWRYWLAMGRDQRLHVWDASSGAYLGGIPMPAWHSFSGAPPWTIEEPDGRVSALGFSMWEEGVGDPPYWAYYEGVAAASWHPERPHILAAACPDGVVRVLKVYPEVRHIEVIEERSHALPRPRDVRVVRWSRDGRALRVEDDLGRHEVIALDDKTPPAESTAWAWPRLRAAGDAAFLTVHLEKLWVLPVERKEPKGA